MTLLGRHRVATKVALRVLSTTPLYRLKVTVFLTLAVLSPVTVFNVQASSCGSSTGRAACLGVDTIFAFGQVKRNQDSVEGELAAG